MTFFLNFKRSPHGLLTGGGLLPPPPPPPPPLTKPLCPCDRSTRNNIMPIFPLCNQCIDIYKSRSIIVPSTTREIGLYDITVYWLLPTNPVG